MLNFLPVLRPINRSGRPRADTSEGSLYWELHTATVELRIINQLSVSIQVNRSHQICRAKDSHGCSTAMSEVEETLNRIKTHRGVVGIVIVNSDGAPIRTTLDKKQTEQYAELVSQLAAKARSVVRDLDPMNDLTFLRIRSKKHEIMVAPDREYILIVIQDPNADQGT